MRASARIYFPQKHFATLPFISPVYILITFHYCYVITFDVVLRCQRPFSLFPH